MTRKSISINIPAAMLALALVAGCGNSNGTTAPDCANIADWFGTYTVVDSSYDCSTRQASVDTSQEVFCYRNSVADPGIPGVKCTSQTCTSTHLALACSGSITEGSCNIATSITATGDRTGNQVVLRSHIVVTPSGNCFGAPPSCEDHVIRANLTSADTTGCGSDAAPGHRHGWALRPRRGL